MNDIPEPDDTTFVLIGHGGNGRVFQRDDEAAEEAVRWFCVDGSDACFTWDELVTEARRVEYGITVLEPTERLL